MIKKVGYGNGHIAPSHKTYQGTGCTSPTASLTALCHSGLGPPRGGLKPLSILSSILLYGDDRFLCAMCPLSLYICGH